MATRRYAKAIVSQKDIHFDNWMEVIRGQNEGAIPKDHVHRIAKTTLRKCDPKQYLLSHATIVASVDTYQPKGSKTGRHMNKGVQIDVRYPDFRIKPECTDIINNNGDAWERSLLLSTYRTFIGAHNYLEHIQLPELSKGFIVDAIARDLGNTCYIDILVATDRKHQQLVNDILSGGITGLSMGCFLPGSMVTMGDGTLLPIEEIRPDMTVMSQKGNVCRVDNLQIRENRWSMRKVKIAGLPVINATDNHDFYVHQPDGSFKKTQAGSLKIGDVVGTPIPNAINKAGVSLAEARLLGLWVGDGWKFENAHGSTVGIGFSNDQKHNEITESIKTVLNQISWAAQEMKLASNGRSSRSVFFSSISEKSSFAEACRSANISRRTGYNWKKQFEQHGQAFINNDPTTQGKSYSERKARNAHYILSTSPAAYNLVTKHVNGRKALDKSISQEVMQWPKEYQLEFLSGIVDSDGCVSTTKNGTTQVFISTRNRNLANQYMTMLARCGIISTLSQTRRSGTNLLPNSSGIDYQIRIRNDGAVQIPSIKIKASLDKIRYTPGNSDRWIDSNYLYAKVKKVESFDYEGFVYDLQVDDDHSYVVNGVGVSNCISLFTICSKCGNVAADDSQLCPCIQYEGKHTEYLDETGAKHKIAELIGHVSVPNSNQFIEASWVKNPAFRGAVRRNFLNADQIQVAAKMNNAIELNSTRSIIPMDGIKKAASSRFAAQGDQGTDDLESLLSDDSETQDSAPDEDTQSSQTPDESQASESKPSDDSADKIDALLDKVQEQLLTIMVEKLADKIGPKPEDVGSVVEAAPISLTSMNDSLMRGASFKSKVSSIVKNPKLADWAVKAHDIVHKGGLKAIKKASLTAKDLLVLSWIEDRVKGKNYDTRLYKLAISVGPMSNYKSEKAFLIACTAKAGRLLSQRELNFLSWKGKIASIATI